MRVAIVLLVLFPAGCSRETPAEPAEHPDLSLPLEEFDKKYFPELVAEVEKLGAEVDEAVAWRKKASSDSNWLYWDREAASRNRIYKKAQEELWKARSAFRERLKPR